MSLGSGAVARGEEGGTTNETEEGNKEVAVKTKVREALWLPSLQNNERKDRFIILPKM